ATAGFPAAPGTSSRRPGSTWTLPCPWSRWPTTRRCRTSTGRCPRCLPTQTGCANSATAGASGPRWAGSSAPCPHRRAARPSIYVVTTDELYPAGRLGQVREAVGAAGLDAVLLTPGPDLRYVIGYDAKQLERLTCLAIPAEGESALFVPRLELAAAQASPAGSLGLKMIPWEETDDPFALVASRLGTAGSVGLSDRMWALSVLKFRDALPGARLALAGRALRGLRIRKTPA